MQPMPADLVAAGADASGPARRLVVAYAFSPYADTSAIVASKRVRVGAEPVDVISNAMDRIRGRDQTLPEVVAGLVRRHAVLPTRTLFGAWPSVEQFCVAGEETLAGWQAEPAGTPYDSMYSRSHFVASHFLAALVKLRRPEVHWQAEFSDPASRYAHGERRRGDVPSGPLAERLREALAERGVHPPEDATVYEWCELLTYTLADEVWFTNAGQVDYCASYLSDPAVAATMRRKARVVPHPSLPGSFYDRRTVETLTEPGVTTIAYFGSFYSAQDPGTLLTALSLLEPGDRARVRLLVHTGDADGQLAARVAQAGVGDVVRIRPRLQFLDFLAATRAVDVLLAIDYAPVAGADSHPVLLSKWSDYGPSGTPVWGVTTEGSPLSGEELAHRSPVGHLTATLQVLTTLARRGPGATGTPAGPS